MIKIIFFIPAILFTALYGFLAIAEVGSISPVVIIWLVLFLASGILLNKNIFWGSLLGMLPGTHLIYMSTQETGQVIDIELPLGIILIIFYATCSAFIFYKKKRSNNSHS